MAVMLDLSPEREAVLAAEAGAQGLTIEQWLLRITEQLVPVSSTAHLQRTDPAEWTRQFREWAESHDRDTPLLPDEAFSRESIYPDRM